MKNPLNYNSIEIPYVMCLEVDYFAFSVGT